MDRLQNSPLNKRSFTTQNVFIYVCWEWLQHMKTLKPNKSWNKLKFGRYKTNHSLTRRLAIALREVECESEDIDELLPDRYRQYWKNHIFEFCGNVFAQNRPDLVLPENYQLPFFSINNPTPTVLNKITTENNANNGIRVNDQTRTICDGTPKLSMSSAQLSTINNANEIDEIEKHQLSQNSQNSEEIIIIKRNRTTRIQDSPFDGIIQIFLIIFKQI